MRLLPARFFPATFVCGLLLGFSLSLSLRAEIKVVKQPPVPNRIFPTLQVLSAAWAGQIPPTGGVSAPTALTSLYPGQKIALAVVGQGPDRDSLLRQLMVSVRFTAAGGGVVEEHGLKPVTIRHIKAGGGDVAMLALEAAGIASPDRAKLEDAMATLSVAVFQPEWSAPSAAKAEDVQIGVNFPGLSAVGQPPPQTLPLRPAADWLKAPPISLEQYGKTMNRYQEDLPPGRLLALLNSMVAGGQVSNPVIASFFAFAYRQNDAARHAAVEDFPSLEPKLQLALMFVLRLGGQDTHHLAPEAPAEVVASLQTVMPLPDPRTSLHFTEPVKPEAVKQIGMMMDQCWSGWMATGDQSFLRAMVGLLAYAPDFPAYQSWRKAKGGLPGFNAAVARGITYQIAGWSLASFQLHDPHVMDWLLYWRDDPTFPANLRREIASLPGNPAFRRN